MEIKKSGKSKLKKLTFGLALAVASVVYLFGVFVLTSLVHESSHLIDFEKVSNGEDSMCILTHPTNWDESVAYYRTEIIDDKKAETEYIQGYTERKAYFVEALLSTVLFSSFAILIFYFRKGF